MIEKNIQSDLFRIVKLKVQLTIKLEIY